MNTGVHNEDITVSGTNIGASQQANTTLRVNYTLTAPFPGAGTAASPYLISAHIDLQRMRILVNEGHPSYDGVHYRLTNNIDVGGSVWTPIGATNRNGRMSFRGTFDGNGNVIYGLSAWGTIEDVDIGLFGSVGSYSGRPPGTIKNLGVMGTVNGARVGNNIGGIVGYLSGSAVVENCFFIGEVPSEGDNVGGIVGFNEGHIRNCYSRADVTGRTRVGGIAGYMTRGTVTNSYATGRVNATNRAAGIVGYASATGSNTITISGNVALNERIFRFGAGDGTSFSRIAFPNGSVTFSNNAARIDMRVMGSTVWESAGHTRDGLGISAELVKTQGTYSASPRNWAFGTSEASPWRWGLYGNTYPLPTLHFGERATPTLPAHLQ